MIVLMARCTASTSVVSPGAAWGERRPSRQEAGHRGTGRRTLSKLASSMTYVTTCQPPLRYTGTTKGMWSPTAMRPSVPPSERPADLRTCWSGWYSGSRLRTPAGLAPAAPGGGVDADPRRPGQGQGPPQAVPQGRHAPLTRPVAAWDLAGWPRQRPIRGRVQGPGRGAGTAGEAVPDPTAPIPPGSSVPARSCLRSRGPCPNTFRAAAGNPAGGPSAPFHALETKVWEDGGMPDAVPPVDLAAWPRAGTIPGRGGGWTGRTCRPTWSGSTRAIASRRTATTRSRCWWWSSSVEASWPLTARSTSWPRWSSLTCPRERSERSRPSMGRWRTCRSTATGRRASRWVGTPSDAEIPTDKRPGRPAVCRSTRYSLTVAATKST